MIFFYLLCLTAIAEPGVDGLSNLTLNLFAMYNGNYDNREQQQQSTEHAFMQIRHLLVDIKSIPDPVWYVEWAVNDDVILMQLAIITEGPGENTYLDLYNFTDISLYKFGKFNVSTLSDYTLDNLSGHNCQAAFKRLTTTVYVGNWPDCRFNIGGNFISFVDTVTCDVLSSVLPPTMPEIFALPPYIFHRVEGRRYPLLEYPDNYDNICGRCK